MNMYKHYFYYFPEVQAPYLLGMKDWKNEGNYTKGQGPQRDTVSKSCFPVSLIYFSLSPLHFVMFFFFLIEPWKAGEGQAQAVYSGYS